MTHDIIITWSPRDLGSHIGQTKIIDAWSTESARKPSKTELASWLFDAYKRNRDSWIRTHGEGRLAIAVIEDRLFL